MITRSVKAALVAALVLAVWFAASAWAADLPVDGDGVVSVRSAYPVGETVARLKRDVADKHIMLFGVIDQAKLAADAGIALRPSTLLLFGNPALGAQFLTANPAAGLDWPVRLLVTEDATGAVWASYTDFAWIARRHGITDRDAAFRMASEVAASIAASVVRK
ncbi:MAG: DUF302 domain-containing protein [Alphaproteobacteria bacterium]|nr:DUF302 domain-containing protein [Alphaproteobacteria bacterium]